MNIIGLPDTAIQEAKERVRAALRNSDCEFPLRRITVNLAPADLKKEDPAYDLPITICMLLSSGPIDFMPAGAVFLGELSLEAVAPHQGHAGHGVGCVRPRLYLRIRSHCQRRQSLFGGRHTGLPGLQSEAPHRTSSL